MIDDMLRIEIGSNNTFRRSSSICSIIICVWDEDKRYSGVTLNLSVHSYYMCHQNQINYPSMLHNITAVLCYRETYTQYWVNQQVRALVYMVNLPLSSLWQRIFKLFFQLLQLLYVQGSKVLTKHVPLRQTVLRVSIVANCKGK